MDDIFGQFGYTRSGSAFGRGFAQHLADKAYGFLVGATDSILRNISEKTGSPYIPPLNGYLAHLGAKAIYRSLFTTTTESFGTDVKYEGGNYIVYNPKVSKEIFFREFRNEFVHANKFFVEFLLHENDNVFENPLYDFNKQKVFSKGTNENYDPLAGFPKSGNRLGKSEKVKGASLDLTQQQAVLLNYMVDNIQFPNIVSKKSSFSRLGQSMDLINNLSYNGDLTITFSVDMRGNIDRMILHLMGESRYFDIGKDKKIDIRITSFNPVHINNTEADFNIAMISGGFGNMTQFNADLTLKSTIFKNVQLSGVPNYSLDQKSRDTLSRPVTFSYLGTNEVVYDYKMNNNTDVVDFMGTALYDMYRNINSISIQN